MNEFQRFVLAFETGIRFRRNYTEPLVTSFARASASGWSDDPADAGGATMCGVTLKTYRAWCSRMGYPKPGKDSLRKIPYSHWRAILKQNYWDVCCADLIATPALARIIVDWVWGSGPKVLKRVQGIVGTTRDGIIGPMTLQAINSSAQEELFNKIKSDRFAYLDEICRSRPANLRFLKGWENRLNAIMFDGLSIYD